MQPQAGTRENASSLQQLLGDIPASQFLDEHYLKTPFSCSGGVRTLLNAAEPKSLLSALLSQRALDIIVGRGGTMRDTRTAITFEESRQFLSDGQTIGMRHVQNNGEPWAATAGSLARELDGAVDLHLYWTPAGQQGFGWHYDAEEVFVLQLDGGKTWNLRKNTVHPWPLIDAIPHDQRYEREMMPIMQCHLAADDWLYIPGGYWHCTQATEESISLSIGVRARTAMDLFDLLRARLQGAIEWRQRLAPRSAGASRTDGTLADEYRVLLQRLAASLGDAMADEAFLRQVLARQQHFCPPQH